MRKTYKFTYTESYNITNNKIYLKKGTIVAYFV